MADPSVAFPILSPAEIAALEEHGQRRAVAAGEYLYRAGDLTYDFIVILSGAVEILSHDNLREEVVARHEAGSFLGELNMLSGMRVFVDARVVEPGEVLAIRRADMRPTMAGHPQIGDKVLTAFLARRELLLTAGPAVRVVGSGFSPEAHAVREFLSRSRIPYRWSDVDADEDVGQLVDALGLVQTDLPVAIAAGRVLRQVTPGLLADYLGLTVDSLPCRCFDLIVVGGGPGGLAAAVYGASEGLRTLTLEEAVMGGQAGSTSRIENYFGFPTGIAGADLTQRGVVQAEKFGARVTSPCAAVSMHEQSGHLVVTLSDGSEVAGRAVIAASGARYRRLPLDRLQDFEGRGVFYEATQIEADGYSGAPVVVVGGGNSAGQAAVFLADKGCRVTMVVRRSDLSSTMSQYLVERIDNHPAIELRPGCEVTALNGEEKLSSVEVREATGTVEVAAEALFSFIGAEPNSGWLSGCAEVDDHGFVLT
ncbi:MAG: FAD-dependent oxidoreductase, partial [Acidimicrobiales bacterium]